MINKLKSLYSNLSVQVKASLWFLCCGFLQKGISLITTPIFTRVMTETQYGRYSVYYSWFSILQIIVSLNLAAGVYTRGLVKNEEDQDRFSSSMLGLNTTCILAWTIVYLIFHKSINDIFGLSSLLMGAMLLDIWANAAFQFWSNRERVNFRYKKLVAITLISVILKPVLGVVTVCYVDEGFQAEGRILVAVAVNALLFSALYIAIAKKGNHFFDKQYWSYALKFNLPLVPHYLSQIILNQSDRLMIDEYCGPSFTAYYSVAYTLAMVLQILNTSISGTMNPWIYKSIKANDFKKIAGISYGVLGVIAISNFLVVAAAPEFLMILAPKQYQAAVWVIPPVTVSVYFTFLYNLFATFEYYYEKTGYVMVASVSGAVLNVILNMIFIPKFGFIAAGYTTLVCYILYAVAHYMFMVRVSHICMNGEKVYSLKNILVIGGILLIASAGIMLLYPVPVARYSLIALIALAGLINRKKIENIIKSFMDTMKSKSKEGRRENEEV